jgi:hypothetical protein
MVLNVKGLGIMEVSSIKNTRASDKGIPHLPDALVVLPDDYPLRPRPVPFGCPAAKIG